MHISLAQNYLCYYLNYCNKFRKIEGPFERYITFGIKRKKSESNQYVGNDEIKVIGAREHNLKDISLRIPKNKMVVITGVSGSGKSSLAFDTIYAEGQRRYMETFSAYARQFLGTMDRPDVEKIEGLSPVISIEQKTTSWNPRSTVGTTTEIYDFMRLLFARAGDAYSYVTGKKMVKYTEDQIFDIILKDYKGEKISILAPMVRSRKGHYRELFERTFKKGFTKVRVDGNIIDLVPGMQLDRYKTHDIEIVIDRITVEEPKQDRLRASLDMAYRMSSDFVMIHNIRSGVIAPFSKRLMDPESGISYEEPSPNTFSFNSPYGSCKKCKGLGSVNSIDMKKVIPDYKKSINQVAIKPFGEVRDTHTFKQLRAIAKKYKFSFSTPISDIPEKALNTILHGGDESINAKVPGISHDFVYNLAHEGIASMLVRWYQESSSEKIRSWAEEFMEVVKCPDCSGYRLMKESLHYKFADKHIGELAEMDLSTLRQWFDEIDDTFQNVKK